MLYNDIKHANVGNKVKVYSTWEFENFNFQYFFLIGLFQLSMEQKSQNLVNL